MATPTATMTRVQELVQWMGTFEQHVQRLRSALDVGTTQSRIVRLQRTQQAAGRLLDKLVSVFWGQEQSDRGKLVSAYLAALLTLKLFADDVCVEALEAALHPRNPADKPDNKAAGDIERAYQRFIERWIVVSPLINPSTHKNNDRYLPKITTSIAAPLLRYMGFSSLISTGDFEGGAHPRQRARDAVARDLRLIRTSPDHARVSGETDHLLGLVFLLAQLELKLRWSEDATDRSGVDSWYRAALQPIEVMRDEVLAIFDDALRTAIVAGTDAEVDRLLTARHLMVVSMATRYSFRRQETRVLLTFFDKQNTTGRFAFQDDVVGVNGVEEKLFSYVGRNDPDAQDNREALSVSSVHARQNDLVGGPVKVFGLIDNGRTQLEDELTKARVDLDVTHSVLGLRGPRRDRRVIVHGELNKPAGTLQITTISIIPHSEGYRALVGFPLRHAQTDKEGRLELTPAWRRMTDGLRRADVREREEHREGVFSVPETLTGQRELVTALLRDQGVRKAVAAALKKKPMDLNLLDRDLRGKVWSALFAGLSQQRQPPLSMRMLNAYLQNYLNLFTQHTYFNVRDSGTPYLSSKWPTDLTDRQFYDCGVYALETAYDLFRATRSVPGLMLKFQFLTFLNHLCLIVYFGDHSFLVNNAEITAPKKMATTGTPTRDDEIAAAFMWGGQAFTTVYDVTYTMFLAVLPALSLDTKRSDAAFKADIWKMYLNSQGWGIANDAAVARDYFQAITLFNSASVRLARQIVDLRDRHKESAQLWEDATRIALELYTLGERMTERSNFVFFNKAFTDAKPLPAVGFSIRPDVVSTTTRVITLPMYELAAMLERRQRDGRRVTPDQKSLIKKPRGTAHVQELSDRFRRP